MLTLTCPRPVPPATTPAPGTCRACGGPVARAKWNLCPGCTESAANPTPEEIAAVCRQIRAGWSDHERRERATGTQAAPPPAGATRRRPCSGGRHRAEVQRRLIREAALALGGVYAAALDPDWSPGASCG